ncbi:MAG: recombinase family protein [Myxococcaceae bacterium]|jgi:DNA invertase Pin-like site-specific DNA recombinase|nr:recombinase family protein [Archangiaceae bacterium]MCU0699400.1 recombinase family protein [Myxococcaceae bacterium]
MNEPNERSLRGKRVGIYARFSSDKQNANSADDQVARCLRLVVERGGKVSPTCCFKDAAISGASLQRPEFERMMGLVRSRQLDVVVVEDPDRLSRDMADSAFLFKEMAFYDVELLSASDGMSSFSPAAKTHFLLKGFMGEMFLDNLRDKTLRGQTARFNAGFATGGVAFGFRTTPKTNGVGEIIAHVISIDEQQADIVRRIFREYLNGRSLALIASALNAEGILPPRSKKRTGAAAWGDSTVRGMLRNEAYAGVWHFARRRWTKVPGTNVRRPKPRSPNDRPVAQERPHLRIIDEKTWTEVQCRLTAVHLHYTRQSAAKSSISGRPSQYPFSGILVCDHCGSLMFVYGKGTGRRYRCTGNAKRGICTNRLSVLESTARTCLLNGLRKHLTNGSIGNARRATCTGPHCSRGSVPRWFRGSARDARRPAASGGAVMAWCQKPTR